jgi:hypothetical protein
MATKTKTRKGAIEKVVESAADAAEEIGQAAVAFKESWDHVRKARSKAAPATRAASRVTKKAVKATKRGVSKLRGSVKRATSRTKKRRK